MKIIETSQGAFGEIKIIDTPQARRMVIAGTVQGACFHDPDANALVAGALPGPGPVIDAPYQLAWLMAGWRRPKAKALMLGMGCGSGAICLLYHFQGLTLDVIEVDPLVVELGSRHFPLVRYYQAQQRLRVVTADAFQNRIPFDGLYDFAIIDLAFDQRKLENCERLDALIASVVPRVAELWLNTIDRFGSNSFSRRVCSFGKAGLPAAYAMSPISPKSWLPIRRNWIITTARQLTSMDAFEPYAGLNTAGARSARRTWQILMDSRSTVSAATS